MRYLSLLLLLLGLMTGCKKTTIISGRITSSANGQPVADVKVTLAASRSTGPSSEILSQDSDSTDANGVYMVEVDGKNSEIIFWAIQKEGFVKPKGIIIERGNRKTIDFILNPRDAWLRLTFENQSDNLAKDFYANCSGIFFTEGQFEALVSSPYLVQPLESRTKITSIPGGADVLIKWDTVGLGDVANKLAVFCPRNDTTDILIKF